MKPPTAVRWWVSSTVAIWSRVGREEPVRAELGRGEADVLHLGEHPLRGELVAPVGDLADSPGDGCAGDPVLGGGGRASTWLRRGISHDCRTSSICTGRCCCRDRVAASAMNATARASSTVHGDCPLPGDDFGEGVELGVEGAGEPVHEEDGRWARRPGGAGFEVAQRGGVAPAGGDAVAGAVQLQSDVVAAGVVPGVGHHRGGTVVEGQQRGAVATSPNSAKKSAPLALPVA